MLIAYHKQCESGISGPSEGYDGNRCNADGDVRLGFSEDAGRFLAENVSVSRLEISERSTLTLENSSAKALGSEI